MPSDELDPKLEAATQEFISVSRNISEAIAIEARGSARYKTSIAISRDWPARLPKHPLSEQITAHIAADHKLRGLRSTVFPNEAAALSWYQQDSLSACNVTIGIFRPHGAALLDGRTQRTVVKKILDALMPESEIESHAGGVEIPGIDLKRAAGVIRYGHAHKVPIPKIVFWFQQEWPWHAIVTEVRQGGLPPGYPMEPEGPAANSELGGHGPQIAAVLRHSIDSDLGLDLARIANWMETASWPLEVSPGKIIAAISDHGGKPSNRFAVPVVELFWLFGRSREMGAWRQSLRDSLQFDLQNLADDAIMRPPEFESESEIVSPSAPAASQLEAAATPDPAVDRPTPKIPESRIPTQQIVESEPPANGWQITMGEKVYRLYEELKCLRNLAKGGKNESLLRRDHQEFEFVWREIDESKPLGAETRTAFFDSLSAAKADGLYEFIGQLYGTGAVNAKLWRVEYRKTLPPSMKRKRSPKKRRLTLAPRSKTS